MNFRPTSKSVTAIILAGMIGSIAAPMTHADLLKGGVEQTDKATNPNTQLNRTDVRPNNDDPFDHDDAGEALDPSNAVFKPQKPMTAPRPPQKPFNMEIEQSGNPNFQGRPATPMSAPMDMNGDPDAIPTRINQPPVPPAFDPSDPDNSPEMQLAWDQWHRRVAGTIFDRFNFFAKAAFKHSPPLLASLSYQVTRDGHIINMNMGQKSNNILFNVLVYQSIKSLEGDMNVLAFPQGSRRMVVAKLGTFTQNYGQEGFKYQTGDQETLAGQRNPPPGGAPVRPAQQMPMRPGMPMGQGMPSFR